MKITCTAKADKGYRALFASRDVPMTVATVEFDIDGEVTIMTFSHRDDDGEGIWCADSRIGPDGYPHFVHGEGERSCSKQIAGPEIVKAIEDFA